MSARVKNWLGCVTVALAVVFTLAIFSHWG